MAREKVVIVGGGFAGIEVAQNLKNADCDILLIDKVNHHISQPLLFQVATGAIAASDMSVPIREIFRKHNNFEFLMGTVVGIDKDKKVVRLADGEDISYDTLVLAPGTRHAYFGHPEWEQFAPGLKTTKDALLMKNQIIQAYEKAERASHNSKERERCMTFVIVGAGPTGVEFAGALAELALKSLVYQYKEIDTTKTKIYLIDALPRILPAFPDEMSNEAHKVLENLGVRILTSTPVMNVKKGVVELKDRTIEAETIIWSAGVEAPSFLKSLNTPLDKQGRVIVQSDLSVPKHPEIFVVGDAACLLDREKKPLPGFVPVAQQQGKHISFLIRHKIPSDERHSFSFCPKSSMATLCRGKAIATHKGKFYTGLKAYIAWQWVQLSYLWGFESFLFVLLRWLGLYATNHRHTLTIIEEGRRVKE